MKSIKAEKNIVPNEVGTLLFMTIDKNRQKGYLYRQIYTDLKNSILDGKLSEHDKLPSKRDLASQLNVSVNTISSAYEQLIAEGYIYAKERSGYYVEKISYFDKGKPTKIPFPDDLKECTLEKNDWLSLSHMATNVNLFPFKDWEKSQQQAIEMHSNELAHITHQQGPYLVRQTISKIINLTRGVACEPEQVVISVGTQPLIEQLIQMQQMNKTVQIAVEDPGYARIHRHLNQIGAHVIPVPLDSKSIDIEKLTKLHADMVLVTPSHQFPMGKIMPISRRLQLLNWATQQSDRYIIEDDYDSEFKYETDQIPSLQSLDRHQRVIYMGTFSKSMLTGLRISYMVLPIPLLRKYRKRYNHLIPYNNTLNLYTLHYFIESGAYARHIKRMNHHYEIKRQLMIKTLKHYFNHSIHIEDIPAGLHFIAHFKTKKSYEEVEEAAEKEKLEVYSLRRFMLKQQTHNQKEVILVIGFAAIAEEKIDEAIKRLYRAIHE